MQDAFHTCIVPRHDPGRLLAELRGALALAVAGRLFQPPPLNGNGSSHRRSPCHWQPTPNAGRPPTRGTCGWDFPNQHSWPDPILQRSHTFPAIHLGERMPVLQDSHPPRHGRANQVCPPHLHAVPFSRPAGQHASHKTWNRRSRRRRGLPADTVGQEDLGSFFPEFCIPLYSSARGVPPERQRGLHDPVGP
jgi:hypothetical protein